MLSYHKKAILMALGFLVQVAVVNPIWAGGDQASPSYTVKISTASVQNNLSITVAGTVQSSRPTQPATAVTIDLLPAAGAAINLVTNFPLPALQTSPYSWTGGMPGGVVVPAGASVRVTSNRQRKAVAPLVYAAIPVVNAVATSKAPAPPAGDKVTCMTGPNSPSPDGVSSTCPVLSFHGLNFWPMSYSDNRSAIDVVATNAAGTVVSRQSLNGTRYIWQVTVDTKAQTVTFYGQGNATAALPWSGLK